MGRIIFGTRMPTIGNRCGLDFAFIMVYHRNHLYRMMNQATAVLTDTMVSQSR
jgi:hypothetical protein